MTETEGHGGSATKTTTAFTYQGLSRLATKEARTRSGSLVDTKTFSYDAVGNRISMNHSQPGSPVERFTYAYDVHGSTSLLLRDSGAVKAAYAYRPYGELDTSLSAGDVNPDDSFNPYRYSGHRYDSGSGSIDMGARRFSPGASRFLSPDMYLGALSDLGLSVDPLTGNRYGLAAGNPVSFVEADGHMLNKAAGGGGTRIPGGPSSGDPHLPDAGNAEPQVDQDVVRAWRKDAEADLGGERLAPQCYGHLSYLELRELVPQCFEGGASLASENEYWFLAATGVSYSPGFEPSTELERTITREALMTLIPTTRVIGWAGRAIRWGAGLLRGVRTAENADDVAGAWRVTNVAKMRPGTLVPESFDLLVAGQKFAVHPNATKHMAEYATSTGGGAVPISSLAGSEETAIQSGLAPGKNFLQVGPWELGIDTIDNVICHAV